MIDKIGLIYLAIIMCIVCLLAGTMLSINNNIKTIITIIEKPSISGDVNGDGIVSITDYTLIRLHILGLEELK